MKKYFVGLLAISLAAFGSAFSFHPNANESTDTMYYFFPPNDQSEPASNVQFTTEADAESTFCSGTGSPCKDAYSQDQVTLNNGILTATGSPDIVLQKL